jgi:hypothetical protein
MRVVRFSRKGLGFLPKAQGQVKLHNDLKERRKGRRYMNIDWQVRQLM